MIRDLRLHGTIGPVEYFTFVGGAGAYNTYFYKEGPSSIRFFSRGNEFNQSLTLISPDDESLSAAYYPGSVSKGVLLLEGFGADQHMMRSLVRDLTASGLHVFTFDYSGHGYSPGALTYDNASTDRLAGQVQTAMTEFQNVSGLDASQIVWLGHSLGARVALQSAVLGPVVPSKLVLLCAQVNLGTNAQSEFFTGTTDADLAWVQSLDAATPPVPILLFTGTWEDTFTVEGAQLLMTKLCAAETTTCDGASPRQWGIAQKPGA